MKNTKLYLVGLLLILTLNNIIAQDTTKFNGHLVIPNGSVGIGTKVPVSKLDVFGGSLGTSSDAKLELARFMSSNSNKSILRIFNRRMNSGQDWLSSSTRIQQTIDFTDMGYIEFNPYNGSYGLALGTQSGEVMRLINNGNVGIGLINPSDKLHLETNSTTPLSIRLNNTNPGTSAGTKISFRYGGAETGYIYNRFNGGDFQTDIQGNDFVRILTGTSSAEAIRVSSSGNIGIGTTNPTTKLDVKGDAQFGATSFLKLIDTGGSNGRLAFSNIGAIDAVAGFLFRNGAGTSEYMRISSTGNIGIGTTTPTAKLDVNGTANFTNSILLSGGSGTNANKIGFNADANSYFIQGISNGIQYSPYSVGNFTFTSGSGYWNFSNGNVGIGITTPPSGYKLAVAGDVIAERIVVKLQSAWPDYVFTPSYKRASLPEIEQYIKQNNHLPNIPSAQEVADKGIDVGALNAKMMEKIEELTLYLIEQNKKIEALEKKNEFLERAIKSSK